jgi:hypothetical protein
MKFIFRTHRETAWVLGIVSAILIIWDYFMFSNDIDGDTISEVTLRNSIRHPIIPFLFGVLGGHLFWYQKPEIK